MEDKIAVVSTRVIDVANPVAGAWTRPCDDCGELTWLSGLWKNKKIDKVVCEPCFYKNSKDMDYVACTTEEIVQLALKSLRGRGVNTTREKLLKNLENKIGRQIKII